MKRNWIVVFVIAILGCNGDFNLVHEGNDDTHGPPDTTDPYAPCTDKAKCCTSVDTICVGDVDGQTVCWCSTLWDCSKEPNKCEQNMPVPGGGSWTCSWTESTYTCRGAPGATPPGGAGWNCKQDPSTSEWVCTKQPPNPTNKPGGTSVWKCTVDNNLDKIVCNRLQPDAGVPPPPPPPPPNKEGNCADGIDNDGDGVTDCDDPDCPPCTNNTPTCPPGQECCDGKDNDGDGKIDEGNVCAGVGEPCPPGAYQSCDCYCGVHRKCNPDGTWGPCKVDGESCQIAQITTHAQCPQGSICDYGRCEPGGFFTFGQQCKGHNDCPTGQVCDLGFCIPDMYTPCP